MLNKAKVFTISSVKGGVGKTTFLLNLAAIFKRLNKKVLVVDLDLYCGDIASTLNIPNASDIYNLFEDINNNKLNNFDDYSKTAMDIDKNGIANLTDLLMLKMRLIKHIM